MLLKKSTIVLCSSSNFHSPTTLSLPASITSSYSPPSQGLRKQYPRTGTKRLQPRYYATENGEGKADRHDEHDHASWPACQNPTPYEIFGQAKGAPYNKTKYFKLVKLYHPDRLLHTSHHHISHATKLERYRLVVAANDILCDPVKRRAYDLYGAGWAGQSDTVNNYREADRAWRQKAGNAANNATWEDWEQWHDARKGEKKQTPLYMTNGLFVATTAVFVLIGAWGQATRAETHSLHLIDLRDQKDEAIAKDMWRRKHEVDMLTREARVEHFLKQRDSYWSHGTTGGGQLNHDQENDCRNE